ncbi:MAG: ferritin-like domain-containing protein [Desulfitobacteriaceae bacterium]|nr:ferritin-like domain-containing protein [Desulfitobacteriaceae bacterium]
MENKLSFKLKEFYILEAYQVYFYSSQLKSFEDPHIISAYELMIEKEQMHVDFFTGQMEKMGFQLPALTGAVFNAAGYLTGKSLNALDFKSRYKLAITFENEAIKMYESFISLIHNDHNLSELTKHLWRFLVDEEFHQYWFKEHLSYLQ